MSSYDYLQQEHMEYVDSLYEQYQKSPHSIDPSWRYFFEGLDLQQSTCSEPTSLSTVTEVRKDALPWLEAFLKKAHLYSNTNPLKAPSSLDKSLESSFYGLQKEDRIESPHALQGKQLASLEPLLRKAYLGSVACEFYAIGDDKERQEVEALWLATIQQEPGEPEKILKSLIASESFERFLHTRYVAQKRFSLEGAESLIPSLEYLLEYSGSLGADHLFLGMAHRGRLNVLRNIFSKPTKDIFLEFEGYYGKAEKGIDGDVKYHMGYSQEKTWGQSTWRCYLAPNPSHLEFIHPVVMGMAREAIDTLGSEDRVLSVLIHGDASFAGQGVVYEALNASRLAATQVGGSIHIIINNQVGFTTNPEESRSTRYASDLAKFLEVPILHVNADDPLACIQVMHFAAQYRKLKKKDIVIDLVAYRKYGHNEGDEPAFTQPRLYQHIKTHPSVVEQFSKKFPQALVQKLLQEEQASLELSQKEAKAFLSTEAIQSFTPSLSNDASLEEPLYKNYNTSYPQAALVALGKKLFETQGHAIHPKLERIITTRKDAILQGKGLDWGTAENLAYASLLEEGYRIRLTGQDALRGTFSHRHAVWVNPQSDHRYLALQALSKNFYIYNSHLSETAMMGFEYGYSARVAKGLILWEAQFGDFANGAQVIIDQFLSSSYTKWKLPAPLVLLLPHGFEGQGPEHSSARLERFLQLSAQGNWSILYPTTPSQIFHALRRQAKRHAEGLAKPLIIMSPKSLLRHPLAISSLDELATGSFQSLIPDTRNVSPRKIILCSGKIYYDLLQSPKASDVALIRIEELYPFPFQALQELQKKYTGIPFLWVQEEPRNMGAWNYIHDLEGLPPLHYVGRKASSSPAVGSAKTHEKEQQLIIKTALE